MNDSLNQQRDTPLKRFNAFIVGIALFGIFGVVSVLAYWFVDMSDPLYSMKSADRLSVKAQVDLAQEELLSDKEIDEKTMQVQPAKVFEKLTPELNAKPKASGKFVPGTKSFEEANAVPVPVAGESLDGAKVFKAKSCNTCHGDDGKSSISPMYPMLAGQGKTAEYLAQKMRDIKSETYVSPLTPMMLAFIQQCSEEEIEAMSKWLGSTE